jgi:AP-2 complex subunit sigma-1
VCELDLLYGFNKVYALVDEMFLAGEVQDTAPRNVLVRLQMLTTVD